MKNSDIKSMKIIFLIIPMILSALGSGMSIHPVFAQIPGLVDIKCVAFCGIPGPQGPAGQNGLNGLNGAPGPKGDTGAQGPAGQNGLNGAQGPQGNAGAPGQNGLNGATGPQGPPGVNGTNGATGPQGPPGVNGTNGATGPQGPPGAPCPHTSTLHEYGLPGAAEGLLQPSFLLSPTDPVFPDGNVTGHVNSASNIPVCVP